MKSSKDSIVRGLTRNVNIVKVGLKEERLMVTFMSQSDLVEPDNRINKT